MPVRLMHMACVAVRLIRHLALVHADVSPSSLSAKASRLDCCASEYAYAYPVGVYFTVLA